MAHPNPTSREPRVLLVEGQDDKHVVGHLLERCQPGLDFEIVDVGSVESLLESVGAHVRAPGRQVVGILIDSNEDIEARWQAVTQRLIGEGFAPPKVRSPKGTIFGARPRVGIWLMPDNVSPGELENFVVQMIPADDPIWPLSQSYIAQIPPQKRKFTEKKKVRAELHAWLAAREDPRRMGTAIYTGDLHVGGVLAQEFVSWVSSLFA